MAGATAKTALFPYPRRAGPPNRPDTAVSRLFTNADTLLAVYGSVLYDVTKDFVFTSRGPMAR